MTHVDSAIDPAAPDAMTVATEHDCSASSDKIEPARKPVQSRKRKGRFGLRFVFVAVLTTLFAAVFAQFVFFAHGVATANIPDGARADAIVVLTGGQARVNEGLRLLEEGRATRLLISGVHPGTTRRQLAAVTASAMPLKKSSVDLDRVALNTAGNAAETASWMRKHSFSSLLLVTSAYHIPRASVELAGVLPEVAIVPYPVFSKDLRLERWYREPATMRLLMREYVKYILARLRITVNGVS